MTTPSITSNNNLPMVGILGDGQLAMMMAQAYQALGGKVAVFGESDSGPASQVADTLFVGNPNELADLEGFFNACDVVTLENEFNDSRILGLASAQCNTPVLPDPSKFGLIEDKLSEKQFFAEHGANLADFFEVKTESDLVDAQGYLKIAKGGYDGLGTYRVNNKDEALEIYQKIKASGKILFEHAIAFKKELSLIAVANTNEIVFYPMVETHQEHGTCRYVTFPAGISNEIEQQAQTQVASILKKLDTCGLFAFEFFLTQSDELIINESAPRPHNSGHITLDLNDCSQFENHMRSIAGLTLVKPKVLHDSMTMINLLGTKNADFNADKLLSDIDDPESSTTLYRKSQSRVKRKMGHINIWGANQEQRAEKLVQNLEV